MCLIYALEDNGKNVVFYPYIRESISVFTSHLYP